MLITSSGDAGFPAAAACGREPRTVTELLRRVAGADDATAKTALIDRFLAGRPDPIVEENSRLFFFVNYEKFDSVTSDTAGFDPPLKPGQRALELLKRPDVDYARLAGLPGIGPRMNRRLNERGISTVEELCELPEDRMRDLWESVLGVWWYHALRGVDLRDPKTVRRSIGHQHVLPPPLRSEAGARGVAVRLIDKAATRTRHLGYWARRLSLSVRYADKRRWGDSATFPECQDTLTLAETLLALGLSDAFRMFEQPEKSYSWWDYRMLGFQKNRGLRIDHILVSEALRPLVKACTIDRVPRKWDKPSDHTPVVVDLLQA